MIDNSELQIEDRENDVTDESWQEAFNDSFAEKEKIDESWQQEQLKKIDEENVNPVVKELTGYLKTIEQFDKDMGQDATALHAYIIQLTNFGARSNFLMAEWQRKFREEKKKAYYKLAASSQATYKYYSPTLAKDFIDAQCSESGFIFDLATRVSRSCVHTMDAIRTVISSLKSERIFVNQQQ